MNLLDIIIDLKVTPTSAITAERRTQAITLGCIHKAGYTGDLFVEVTNTADLADILDTSHLGIAELIFNKNIKLYLLLKPDITTEFTPADVEKANGVSFSLFLAIGTPIAEAELSGFTGVVYFSADKTSPALDRASGANTAVFVVNTTGGGEKLGADILSDFVSLNNFNNMQYRSYATYTPVYTTRTEVETALADGLIFIAKDNVSIKSPVLMNLQAGKLPLADIYIKEDLRLDIQVASYNYIANNKPAYLDEQIANLTAVGQGVIDIYISRGLIESAEYTIPNKALQTANDIALGVVSNVVTKSTPNGAIWRLQGSIQ